MRISFCLSACYEEFLGIGAYKVEVGCLIVTEMLVHVIDFWDESGSSEAALSLGVQK